MGMARAYRKLGQMYPRSPYQPSDGIATRNCSVPAHLSFTVFHRRVSAPRAGPSEMPHYWITSSIERNALELVREQQPDWRVVGGTWASEGHYPFWN
jgi:hypothetical protein